MKSVVAAKAVLFPEAEEKAILPREIVVNMEGEQHRKSRRCRFVGDARRYISKNQRIVVFRLIQ